MYSNKECVTRDIALELLLYVLYLVTFKEMVVDLPHSAYRS